MPRVIGLPSRARPLEAQPQNQDARSRAAQPLTSASSFTSKRVDPLKSRASQRDPAAAKREQTSPRAKDRFLAVYATLGNVTYAAKAAGVGRATVYIWLEHDEEFAQQMRQAEIQATEVLEREAWRRARDGYAEPVYQHGKQVGTIQRYSDNLLMFLLRARDPSRFGTKVDVTTTPTIKVLSGFTPESVL